MDRSSRAIMILFKKTIATPHKNITFRMDSQNIHVWYAMIHSLPGEYTSGEYLCKLELPEDFPFSPPKFIFLTKNGVYDIGGNVCIALDGPWKASMGMVGFVEQLISNLIGWQETPGIPIHTTYGEKQFYAQESKTSNQLLYPEILELINSTYSVG